MLGVLTQCTDFWSSLSGCSSRRKEQLSQHHRLVENKSVSTLINGLKLHQLFRGQFYVHEAETSGDKNRKGEKRKMLQHMLHMLGSTVPLFPESVSQEDSWLLWISSDFLSSMSHMYLLHCWAIDEEMRCTLAFEIPSRSTTRSSVSRDELF